MCVCQRVRVEISNSSANVVALVEFVSLLLLMQVQMYASEGFNMRATVNLKILQVPRV